MFPMNTSRSPITQLTDEQSLELLATKSFGRLVLQYGDHVDLFPLNYLVNEGKLLFRTAEGSKLLGLRLNDSVLFEADNVGHADQTPGQAWSIIVRGNARILTKSDEIHAADELSLNPWVPTLKYNYVEVTPKENGISGRLFTLGKEPDRY